MSFFTLRVELPAYSHSFEVQITPSSTILDVKHEVAKVCPGSPSPAGQRLIWRGRFLKDEERVEDVWKSVDDSRVIHLAVHPSAWTSTPPTLPSATFAPASVPLQPQPTPTQPRASAGQSAPSPTSYLRQPSNPFTPVHPVSPVAYIQYIHNLALGILSAGAISLPPHPSIHELETWRSAAKDLYRTRGWIWPSAFDDPVPSGSAEQGAVYEPVTLEGLPYLQLATPGAIPTSSQAHALRVLSHTFSILSMANDPMLYVPVNPYPTHPYATATNLNQHIQELGFPALRHVHNPGANPNPNDANNHNPLAAPGAAGGAEIRAIPMRALMVPLMMLVFRTLLLLYFFSPSKRPLFGLLLSVWILYEAWNAMRLVLNDGIERGADGVNPAAPNAPLGAGQPGAPAAGLARPNANAAPNAVAGNPGFAAILDRLSMINLAAEDALLDTDAPAPPPGLGQKAKMFVLLFFTSLHPAAWDRRRNALRRREGRIRTEANAREVALSERAQGRGEADGQAQPRSEEDEARARAREQMVIRHERRPAWLKEYVQRVQYTEWVDDP